MTWYKRIKVDGGRNQSCSVPCLTGVNTYAQYWTSLDSDLILEPFDLRVLVFELRAELIGSHLLRLHDLNQVDVLLHEHLALDDEVRVAEEGKLPNRILASNFKHEAQTALVDVWVKKRISVALL